MSAVLAYRALLGIIYLGGMWMAVESLYSIIHDDYSDLIWQTGEGGAAVMFVAFCLALAQPVQS